LERGRELQDLAFSWPRGESRGAFDERVREAFSEIIAAGEAKTVAVVSHSAVLSTDLARAVDGVPWQWPRYRLGNCALTEVAVEDGAFVWFDTTSAPSSAPRGERDEPRPSRGRRVGGPG
jgi:broad specificity phosphatase PhoE